MTGESSSFANRRTISACLRCRQQKIKCTGENPCRNCQRRNVTCAFERDHDKVLVAKKHLLELKQRIVELERGNHALRQRYESSEDNENHVRAPSPITEGLDSTAAGENSMLTPKSASMLTDCATTDANIVNPLTAGPPTYIVDRIGKVYYLGHTSTWSLTMRLLELTHEALYKCPFPAGMQRMDETIYNLGWDGSRHTVMPNVAGLPSLDHSLFLMNVTKFHTGQMFHLFDETSFMAKLYEFYRDPAENMQTGGLWFIQFLVIMALGKAFTSLKANDGALPGANLFLKAYMMLPDYSCLWREPSLSGELLCAMALYLQCIDWRMSAHNMIGQALRIMLVHGYHTNIPRGTLEDSALERSRKVWWTVFNIERQISVLLGIPSGVSNQDITAPLPSYPELLNKSAMMRVHVKLSQAFGLVVDKLYGQDSHVNAKFVRNAQKVLQSVAGVAPELTEYFPIPEDGSLNGISRDTGYMNLLYHQCIMVATRPFLVGLIIRRIESGNPEIAIPASIKLLLQVCVDSGKKTIYILQALQRQQLLEYFLPMDLESALSAGLIMCMVAVVAPFLVEGSRHYLEGVLGILADMVEKGNLVAEAHKDKLGHLEALLSEFQTLGYARRGDTGTGSHPVPEPGDDNGEGFIPEGEGAGLGMIGGEGLGQVEAWELMQDITASQLMTVASALDVNGMLDWVGIPADGSMDEHNSHPSLCP
ncbi:hypothetical protein BDV26DRAFT_34367 [Aspergillus bertholletiae]|uniref:Zn(2)-C6 fungal-type domain-containing protein n=1 Tax=Aspergillus bertholletiae TaxID=1226010 RepID=A0A5N7B027_9EURO|nr:hypothetical protein BDV26DRAFT_34367 [Aspergillus bertholletiae]